MFKAKDLIHSCFIRSITWDTRRICTALIMSLWVSLFLLCNRLVEYLNIYQLSICFSNVVVLLLDGKLGGLSSRGRLSAEPLLDCSTLDRQGGLRLVRLLLLLLTWPTACWPSMARPQPFQYSQYTLTEAQSMWHGAVILALEKWKVWSWILCRRSLRATPWSGLHPYPWSTLIRSSTLLVCLDYTIIPTKRNHCKSQKSFDYLIRNCSILTRTPLTKSGPYIRFSCKTNKHLWKYGI